MLSPPSGLEYRDVAVRAGGACEPAHHRQKDHHASTEETLRRPPTRLLMRTIPHISIPIYLCFLLFSDEDGPHLVQLPHRALTDFSAGLTIIQFHPNPNLLRAPSTMPCRYTVQRPGGHQQGQSAAAFPLFPPMRDMSTRPKGDFQRVIVDAFTAIWA
ncbi:hypothetical protein F2Q69_00052740 [Brassica cretica]|uniref:Uncharacterized protein n=1 Tax=Brassica cretica TaxID=69181 RepID=A0A8S9MSX4_BRACR|nr:hypothetical protein F2Q69_00052740 [Brassica cretica]